MWEEEWYYDPETGDEYPVGGEWVKMDEYDMEHDPPHDDFAMQSYKYQSEYGDFAVSYYLDPSTGEFKDFFPYDQGYVLELPADGSYMTFARLVQPIF